MAGINWQCTTCGNRMTLTGHDFDTGHSTTCTATGAEAKEGFHVTWRLYRCPNRECQASDIAVSVWHGEVDRHGGTSFVSGKPTKPAGIGTFQFLPTTPAPLSTHAPASVIEDYNEAYLIRDLSPKASATLARRALQGMVHQFWSVSKNTLHEELTSIKGMCDPALHEALMAVKSIGNIGAHPERDISLVVDIEDGEAQQLLEVIRLLDREWFVARADRQRRIENMAKLAQDKKAEAMSLADIGKLKKD